MEFEGIRNPTLFKIILGVNDSIEAYYFKLMESRTSLICLNGGESKTPIFKLVKSRTLYNGRIKDSINLIQSGKVKDFICLFDL